MQTEFQTAYQRLKGAQKDAVEEIYGTLLVLAGPGTGKTELLSVRVANILRKTDLSAGNILCLSFTESAQANMQARLGKLIGPLASQVAVHTFHSYGSHLIGTHGDYFNEAFGFRPSDDVTRYRILAEILQKLPRDNRLAGLYDGQFFYLKDIQQRISQLKQAGLLPETFRQQVVADQSWLKTAEPILQATLGIIARLSAGHITAFSALAQDLPPGDDVQDLASLCYTELGDALEAAGQKATKPLTAWKNRWLTKNREGQFVFAATKQLHKLAELADVYKAYQDQLASQRLYDYDDMIMRVISVLQAEPDLRAELQEQYQFILVDEYQDTNGAQLQLINLLAANSVNEPNLMVVGDDDQAIYGFQGAYHSNVLDFLRTWPNAKQFVLTINFRSTVPILALARQVIVQGEDRLEASRPELNKQLSAHHNKSGDAPKLQILPSDIEQLSWLAEEVQRLVQAGTDPTQIALIAPKHKYLEAIVPYLQDRQLAVAYERREDVLEQPHISQLLRLARVITNLGQGEIALANHQLPELLSYPWWGIEAGWLWELSLAAKETKQPWLELMRLSDRPELVANADWLLGQAKASHSTPLEPMMDQLIGPAEVGETYSSPYRRYYFGVSTFEQSVTYVRLLSGLVSLRTALRQYQPSGTPNLADFVAFADLRLEAGLQLRNDHPLVLDKAAVKLLTVHKAKGLEFEHVFLLNANEHTWRKERGRTNNISLPPNWAALAPAGDTADEKLRMFYVAMTRARQDLTLVNFATKSDGQPSLPIGWLQTDAVAPTFTINQMPQTTQPAIEQLSKELGFDWLATHFELRSQAPWRALLEPTLCKYKLSPTHLTAFLDVSRGGPKAFLVNQLLRFPQALSVNAQFGNVMHAVMQRLHTHYNEHGKLPKHSVAEIWLDQIVADYYFGPVEEPKAQHRGRLCLAGVYQQLANNFQLGQLAEYDFAGEGIAIGEARLVGKIDALQIDKTTNTAQIVDYKTGKSFTKWHQTTANGFEAHKAHRFRQQLLFYKLLVEHSRSFSGYTAQQGSLVFVEPNEDGQLETLPMAYDSSELQELEHLIKIVYQKIITLDLPDTSNYSQDYAGTLAFEADLFNDNI